jgi:hypothetical protein
VIAEGIDRDATASYRRRVKVSSRPGRIAPARRLLALVPGLVAVALSASPPTISSIADALSSVAGPGPRPAAAMSTDSALAWSALVGGEVRGIATDAAGNVYLAGGADSPDFPVTPGAFRSPPHSGVPDARGTLRSDVFVAKLDPSGRLLWSTSIGGPNHDRAYAIAVDDRGYVYVAGRAGRGFPVTPGAFQPDFRGGPEVPPYGSQDGFVCKLTPDGAALVFCSYFGTEDASIVRDVAVDAGGDIFIASGYGHGTYRPSVSRAFTNAPRGDRDAVAAKISSDGSQVLWATYLGGSGWEGNQNSVRLDGAGNPYILVTTKSKDAPTTPGAYQRRYAGDEDLYVAKLSPQHGTLMWATYLGGPRNESTETHELAVDPHGNVYVAAPTKSPTFPTTEGAFQRTFGGMHDVFVAKISPDGTRLLGSTFVGGDSADRPEGVDVDASGNVYFTGTTTSRNFPVTAGAAQPALRGPRDAIAVVLAADFSRLLYSTFVGGNGADFGRAAAVDPRHALLFAGETDSTDWPAGKGAGSAGFAAKIVPPGALAGR